MVESDSGAGIGRQRDILVWDFCYWEVLTIAVTAAVTITMAILVNVAISLVIPSSMRGPISLLAVVLIVSHLRLTNRMTRAKKSEKMMKNRGIRS
jgi:hypothetical protein